MRVRFIDNDRGNPPGKLADAELHFDAIDGDWLMGLRLVGFAVWERRGGGLNVTWPARQYQVNGERRSFALLRIQDGQESNQSDALREAILAAYREHRAELAPPAPPAPVNAAPVQVLAAPVIAVQAGQPAGLAVTPAPGFLTPAGPSDATIAAALRMLPTVPPADVTLPGLAGVRCTENPDPAPVADLPRANPADFSLRAVAAPVAQVRFDF